MTERSLPNLSDTEYHALLRSLWLEHFFKKKINIDVKLRFGVNTILDYNSINISITTNFEEFNQSARLTFDIDEIDSGKKYKLKLYEYTYGSTPIRISTKNDKLYIRQGQIDLEYPIYVKDMIEEKLKEIVEYWKKQDVIIEYEFL